MNKKLIALAVGAAMAAPMAASAAPTFYGQLQAEIGSIDNGGYGDGNGANVIGLAIPIKGSKDPKYPPGTRQASGAGKVQSGASGIIIDDNKRGRLGVKGSEDLGGSLKAIYKFEWQVETTAAKVDDGTREAYVGLKGGWGEFQVGSLKSAYKYTGGVKYDPLVATFLEARSNGGMAGRDTDLNRGAGRFGQHGFLSNSLSYRYKGKNWSLWGNYSPDQAGGRDGRDGDYAASFKFFAKNWEVFVAAVSNNTITTGDIDQNNSNPDSPDSYDAVKVGGQFKLGKAHRFSVQYEQTSQGTVFTDGDPNNQDLEADVIFLGYVFQMGKNQFIAQAGKSDFDSGGDAGDTTYYALAWKYKFSKKTSAWLGYRSSDYSIPDGGQATLSDGSTTSNLDLTAISAGLRIDF